MAKKSMATTLTVVDSRAGLAALFPQDMAFVGAEDGIGEVEREDLKIPIRTLNFSITNADGDPTPKNHWVDTVEERSLGKSIRAIFMIRHKSHAYTYFDNDKNETVRVCASYDRITGTVAESGETRPCEGCPHSKWMTGDKGKRSKDCAEVQSVLCLDPETMEPFMVRFKKTSMDAIKSHLQKHHIGKMRSINPAAPQGANVPLYAFIVQLTGVMDAGGNFARPVPEVVSAVTPEMFASCRDMLGGLAELMRPMHEAPEPEQQPASASRVGFADLDSETPF